MYRVSVDHEHQWEASEVTDRSDRHWELLTVYCEGCLAERPASDLEKKFFRDGWRKGHACAVFGCGKEGH